LQGLRRSTSIDPLEHHPESRITFNQHIEPKR
jgi:hypothetical protein